MVELLLGAHMDFRLQVDGKLKWESWKSMTQLFLVRCDPHAVAERKEIHLLNVHMYLYVHHPGTYMLL